MGGWLLDNIALPQKTCFWSIPISILYHLYHVKIQVACKCGSLSPAPVLDRVQKTHQEERFQIEESDVHQPTIPQVRYNSR